MQVFHTSKSTVLKTKRVILKVLDLSTDGNNIFLLISVQKCKDNWRPKI